MTRKADLRELDAISTPDQWEAIRVRKPSSADLIVPARTAASRFAAAGVALVVAVGAGLFLIRAFDHSQRQEIKHPPATQGSETASPLGQLVAFVTLDDRIATVLPGGGGVHVLTTGHEGQFASSDGQDVLDGSPQWSTDGTTIDFFRIAGAKSWLCSVGADGAGFHVVRELDGAHLALSPDGTRMAYYSVEGSLHESNFDGSDDKVLVASTPDPYGGWGPNRPAWSPDGTEIAYTATASGQGFCADRCALWVMNIASGVRRNLTADNPDERVVSVAWSPGARIAFADTTTSDGGVPLRVWTIDSDGTGLRRVTTEGDTVPVSWSPDGTMLLLGRFKLPNSQDISWHDDGLLVANPDGSKPEVLVEQARSAFGAWRP